MSRDQTTDKVPVMDLHSDIVLRMIDHDVDIGNPPEWPQTTLPGMEEGHVKNQVFAIWVNSRSLVESLATHRAIQMIDEFHLQQQKYPDRFGLATSVAEARALNEDGKIAAWLFLEGGAPIANDIRVLRQFHRMGVRGMTLTWMNNLLWAGAATDSEDPSMGLTELGIEVVHEMNRLGMVIDVSHCSEQTFYDAIELSKDPVVASHSSCYALYEHPRNLKDDQLRALAENGGVIAINAYPKYVSPKWEKGWDETAEKLKDEIEALKESVNGNTSSMIYRDGRRALIQAHLPKENVVDVDDYVDHIDHAVKIMGWEHVGLGADFDGISAVPVGLEKASKWQNVVAELRNRGYTEEMIRGIMHDNAMRVFEEVIDK